MSTTSSRSVCTREEGGGGRSSEGNLHPILSADGQDVSRKSRVGEVECNSVLEELLSTNLSEAIDSKFGSPSLKRGIALISRSLNFLSR